MEYKIQAQPQRNNSDHMHVVHKVNFHSMYIIIYMYVTYDLSYYFFMYIMYYGIMHNTNIHKKVVQKIISYTKSTCIRSMRYNNWIMFYL